MKRPFRGLAADGRGQPGLRQQCSPNDQALRAPPPWLHRGGGVGSRGVGAARTQPFLPGGPCTPCAPAAAGSGTWDHRLPEARTDRESRGKCGAHAAMLWGSQATVWRTFSYQLSPSNQEWGQDPGSTDGAGDRDRLLGAVSGAAAPSGEVPLQVCGCRPRQRSRGTLPPTTEGAGLQPALRHPRRLEAWGGRRAGTEPLLRSCLGCPGTCRAAALVLGNDRSRSGPGVSLGPPPCPSPVVTSCPGNG